MTDSDIRALEAVKSVIGVADSNFPDDCMVRISAEGKNSATITLPAYRLRSLLKETDK